ncbi:MAG: hypothetical protein ABIJ57_03120 [Pseudomonadota bacterium]
MTEEGAKTKWCANTQTRNMADTPQATAASWQNCIASACMMWRWELTREEAENGHYPKDGYCGLAGRP